MERTCIIFNPTARGDKAQKFRARMEKMGGFELMPTTGPGAARGLAKSAIENGFHTVVAAGGDGTINEVLNGFADAENGFENARLGVLPLGTVNVFARELKLPWDAEAFQKMIEQGKESRIDIGCAEWIQNGELRQGYFVQLAGAGLDARAVELVSWELKKKIGPAAYLVAGFRALSSRQPNIEITNGRETECGELILIGNGKLYGGDFPLLHRGDLQDGKLDAIIFRKVNWAALPGHLWSWLSGKIYKPEGSIYLQGSEFKLTSSERAVFQLDGELMGELPVTLRVKPACLRVIVP